MVHVNEPLPDRLAELVAARFRVLAEPTRLKLLARLQHSPATVGELAADLGTTQQNTSKHLGVLHQADIVDRKKHGNFVRYRICDASVLQLCDVVCGTLRQRATEISELLGDNEPLPAGTSPGPPLPG